jgi:hypothetical protein
MANGVIHKGLEAEFFRYFTKPVRVDDFMGKMNRALAFAAKTGDGAREGRDTP